MMTRTLCTFGLLLALAAAEARAQVVLQPTRYELDVEVDYTAEVLRGTAGIVLQNASSQPVRQASLLLYRLMTVQSVRGGQGKDLPFTQAVVAFEDFGKLQVNQVLVDLPEPLAPGAETLVRVQYEGHLLGYAETGMRYIKDRIDPEFTILRNDAYAYPIPGVPSIVALRRGTEWSFTYNARITVPRGLTVVSGGRLDDTQTEGDRVTFRYSSPRPSWRMDFAIAKYGELASGPVRIFYLPGDADGAGRVAQAAGKALDLFGRWFGPRQEDLALTFIEIPDDWGSQADAMTVIQTAAAFRDSTRHREVYHEISHLWNVPATDHPAPRWNEGLASFLELLAQQEFTGEPVVDAQANRRIEQLRRALPTNPKLAQVPLVEYGRSGLTGYSYTVGALFFDLLYRLAGPDAFRKIIRDYNTRFAAGGSTQDLAGVIREATGVPETLVTEWIFTTRWTDRTQKCASIEDLGAIYGIPGGSGQE